MDRAFMQAVKAAERKAAMVYKRTRAKAQKTIARKWKGYKKRRDAANKIGSWFAKRKQRRSAETDRRRNIQQFIIENAFDLGFGIETENGKLKLIAGSKPKVAR